MNHKTGIKNYHSTVKMESTWLDHPQWHAYFLNREPTSKLEKALHKAYKEYITKAYRSSYKCIYGSVCSNYKCTHVHPGEEGYIHATYYQNDKKCQFESDLNACRLKCGSENGRYCPYNHCKHGYNMNTLKCTMKDCQGHCSKCI